MDRAVPRIGETTFVGLAIASGISINLARVVMGGNAKSLRSHSDERLHPAPRIVNAHVGRAIENSPTARFTQR